jgi:DNA-binding NtrC family response regulator
MIMENKDIGIMIVDDEPSIRNSLHSWFEKDGFRTKKAANAVEALKELSIGSFQIVLLDIKMPDINGMELQKRIRKSNPNIEVIMITAYASVESAVEAIKQGAFDYIVKPIDPDKLSLVVKKAIKQQMIRRKDTQHHKKTDDLYLKELLVGDCPQISEVLKLINAVSQTDMNVLIQGERGTGKKLVARLIHANSSREFFPLVPVSCGSLGELFLENELFGIERNPPTNTHHMYKGKLNTAIGGAIYLDGVESIRRKTQGMLYHVIEKKEYNSINRKESNVMDFKIMSSTNQDLQQLVEDGMFRRDLFNVINQFKIVLPLLRDRRMDIPLLAKHFIQKYSKEYGKRAITISKDAMNVLIEYDWPGNVRELEVIIERAVVVQKRNCIELNDLPSEIISIDKYTWMDSLDIVEKNHIIKVLEKTSWNISRAAQRLGVDRATLYNKIKKYGLSK